MSYRPFPGPYAKSTGSVALITPILTWTSAANVSNASFSAEFVGATTGDVVTLQRASDAGFTTITNTSTHAITSGEAVSAPPTAIINSGVLPDATYYFRVRLTRGSSISAWSNGVTVAIVGGDSIAPTLTLPVATTAGSYSATLGVTTNEATGTLYAVATVSTTAPTIAQVKLGLDSAGVAATYAGNQAITSTGAKTLSATGLLASTTYKAFYMHEDASTNQSIVSSSTTFTTNAAATTWDTANKAAGITLTNSNLTASNAATTDQLVRAIANHTTGKYYYEVQRGASGVVVGLANASQVLTDYLGNLPTSIGWGAGGTVYQNGVNIAPGGAINTHTTNDWLAVAIDVTNKLIWFKNITAAGNWNNNVSNDPATGVGGITYSATGAIFPTAACQQNSAVFTANFGGSAYTGTAPSGYGNW